MASSGGSPGSPPESSEATADNAFWPIAITTVAWFVSGMALLVMGDGIPEGQRWWTATCAVGVISGIGGMIYVKRRAGRPRRAAARRARAAQSE